ncbi:MULTISPECIES: hypothetical protein [Methylobacterium]|uniref:Glycine/betaine ABC transporter permease n=1 Tax=Methylobacterium longum TaxID=767694 RepID=A0ABT8ARU7_9HYPH|nr:MULTISPECIES: hypothetical protein [Methylobacterium]MCJ2099533.1 hypothetical protein [Methylobacterium sp. E-046]MDN3572657.1 hypothetical protein [Methylobacterium longum]GJE12409.1 hypothetical protein FOHLNKBM_3458 [Methylobacterium longum]
MDQGRTGTIRRGFDWIFRDRTTGVITIAQWPNLPLWLFGGLTVAAWLAREAGSLATWLTIGADLALAWWALDEVLRGVNPWRRFLGAATLAGLIALVALRRSA